MLASWSLQSTPAELSIESVLIFLPAGRTRCGPAASARGSCPRRRPLTPQLPHVHPDGVVGLVADIRMGLLHRLGIGADAAVPQQVHRGTQDRADQLIRGGRRGLRWRRRGYDREARCRWIAVRRMLRRQLRRALASLKETGSAYFSPVL